MSLSPRICPRCGEEKFGEPGSHVCKDIAKRLARREKQVQAVMDIWSGRPMIICVSRKVAQEIVQKLSEMGVTDD